MATINDYCEVLTTFRVSGITDAALNFITHMTFPYAKLFFPLNRPRYDRWTGSEEERAQPNDKTYSQNLTLFGEELALLLNDINKVLRATASSPAEEFILESIITDLAKHADGDKIDKYYYYPAAVLAELCIYSSDKSFLGLWNEFFNKVQLDVDLDNSDVFVVSYSSPIPSIVVSIRDPIITKEKSVQIISCDILSGLIIAAGEIPKFNPSISVRLSFPSVIDGKLTPITREEFSSSFNTYTSLPSEEEKSKNNLRITLDSVFYYDVDVNLRREGNKILLSNAYFYQGVMSIFRWTRVGYDLHPTFLSPKGDYPLVPLGD